MRPLALATVLMLAACQSGSVVLDVPEEADADTDADADADTDADSDADSDSDTDADSDADSDSDTDTDPVEDSEWKGDYDTWTYVYAYVDEWHWETEGEGKDGWLKVGRGAEPEVVSEDEIRIRDWDSEVDFRLDSVLDGDRFEGEVVLETYGEELVFDVDGEFFVSDEGDDLATFSTEDWQNVGGYDVYFYVEMWAWR